MTRNPTDPLELLLQRLEANLPVIDGLHDLWQPYRDAELFDDLVHALVEPFRGDSVSAVLGCESRGFILGGAASLALRVAFVAVRKPGGYMPGAVHRVRTTSDWQGKETEFHLQKEALPPNSRVLLVDDWFTTGSHALAVKDLVEQAGGVLFGAAVLVDEMPPGVAAALGKYHALLRYDEEVPLSGDGTFRPSRHNLLAST